MSRRLNESALFRQLFGPLVPHPFLGQVIGESPAVEVVPHDGDVGFSGICFQFSVGWGDGEAGCIHSHYWIIRCQAVGAASQGGWRIDAVLLEEGGDGLSEFARAKLCSEGR